MILMVIPIVRLKGGMPAVVAERFYNPALPNYCDVNPGGKIPIESVG